MEDAVIHAESILHPQEEEEEEEQQQQQQENQNHGKDGAVKKEYQGRGEDGSSTGLINMLTNLATPKEVYEEKEEVKEGEDRGKKSAGLLDHLISSLVSPKAAGSDDKDRAAVFQDRGGEREKNYGKEEKMAQTDKQNDQVKTEEEGNGGIIDNIVSHLSVHLPDDAAPTTDEASILIHAIVHE